MSWLRNVAALTGVVILLTCPFAAAQGPTPSAHKAWLKSESQTRSASGGSSTGGVLAKSLLVIAAVGCGGYLLWRRSQRRTETQPLKRAHVRVLSGTPIGPKARAVVAEVGGRLILLGVTEHSVRRLAWLDSDSEGSSEPARPDSNRSSDGETDLARHVSNARTSPSLDNGKALLQNQRSSNFSDVLRDAVGIKPKRSQDPALTLAETTRDRVSIHGAQEKTSSEAMYVDVEGQAAGLVARLNRRT